MLFLCLFVLVSLTAGEEYHQYAILSKLSRDELEPYLNSHGLYIEGQDKLQNLYRARSNVEPPPSLDDDDTTSSIQPLAKRADSKHNQLLSKVLEHPLIHHIEYQPPLQIERRLPPSPRRLYYVMPSSERPQSIKHVNDSAYDKAYKEYAKQAKLLFAFNDPLSPNAWQYLNEGSKVSSAIGLDLNIYPAYARGLTGRGSNVLIIDDAFDTLHPDLKENYDPDLSINLDHPEVNGLSPRGPNKLMKSEDGHGTRCAGLIGAVANNSICSHGVAFHTRMGGIRFLTGHTTDAMGPEGLNYKIDQADIYCSSWGPLDNGKLMDRPKKFTEKALDNGVKMGRHGLGSLYVFASGNGGIDGDSCGADGYVSYPRAIAVSALDKNGQMPEFGERCSAVRVSVPLGSTDLWDSMPTTSENSQCEKNFQGTSAAAPLAAGCFALALESNPALTLRQFENLLPLSTRLPSPGPTQDGLDLPPSGDQYSEWQVNSNGLLYNPAFGYGLLNCARLTRLASEWNVTNPEPLCSIKQEHGKRSQIQEAIIRQAKWPKLCPTCQLNTTQEVDEFVEKKLKNLTVGGDDIFRGKSANITFEFGNQTQGHLVDDIGQGVNQTNTTKASSTNCFVEVAEKVRVELEWIHACRGSLVLRLHSPTGFVSLLLHQRPLDFYAGQGYMTFSANGHWGEPVQGKWILEVIDTDQCGFTEGGVESSSSKHQLLGKVLFASLELQGTSQVGSASERNKDLVEPLLTSIGKQARRNDKAKTLTFTELADTFDEQRWSALDESQKELDSYKQRMSGEGGEK